MTDDPRFYSRKTLASWDEAAAVHAQINASLAEEVADPAYNNLNADFNQLIDAYGVEDKSVIQLCCNNGVDLLLLRKKGAARCVGVDGSAAFVEQARTLAKSAGCADVEYTCCDIYEFDSRYDAQFDRVLITVGVVGWMPDIEVFFRVCESVLKPDGVLVMEELHPVLGMYEEGNPSSLEYSYFDTEPYEDSSGLDYFTHKKYDARPNYSFQHSLSALLMAALRCRLQLEHIHELSCNVGNYCADLEHSPSNPPLGINLAWRKPA